MRLWYCIYFFIFLYVLYFSFLIIHSIYCIFHSIYYILLEKSMYYSMKRSAAVDNKMTYSIRYFITEYIFFYILVCTIFFILNYSLYILYFSKKSIFVIDYSFLPCRIITYSFFSSGMLSGINIQKEMKIANKSASKASLRATSEGIYAREKACI
jgi:hypothetical protein